MKIAAHIAAGLLSFAFLFASIAVLFNLVSAPPPVPGSAAAMFMGALGPTGYLKFIKVLELIGAILVAVPLTRNIGLLILGPIIVNIIAFNVFITKWTDLLNPMIIVICLCAGFLLWVERRAWAGLVNRA